MCGHLLQGRLETPERAHSVESAEISSTIVNKFVDFSVVNDTMVKFDFSVVTDPIATKLLNNNNGPLKFHHVYSYVEVLYRDAREDIFCGACQNFFYTYNVFSQIY